MWGDNVPSLLRHVPRRGYKKVQIRLHILTSLVLRVHKTLCFQLFPAEIDGIRSGYYYTRNTLKPTYSHLRSQNFPGEKPWTLAASGVETGGSGDSMNWGSELIWAPIPGQKNYTKERKPHLHHSQHFRLPVLAFAGRPMELRAPGFC